MKKLSVLTVCLFTLFVAQAQTNPITGKKHKTPRATILTMDGEVISGRLHSINDNQLVMKTSYNDLETIPAGNIRSVYTKDKNGMLKGAIAGFAIGALAGMGAEVLGNFYYGSTSKKQMVKTGLIFGGCGAALGAVLGSLMKTKIPIRGRKERFRALQSKLTF